MSRLTRIKASSFRPLKNFVFVTEMDEGARLTRGGIIIPDDNGTDRGIHARWARVHLVGPNVTDIQVGDWVLIEHGRWTERMTLELADGDTEVWQIDYPNAVLVVSDTDPREEQRTDLTICNLDSGDGCH